MTRIAQPPFEILINTCVWLGLAKDYKQQPILVALDQLIQSGDVELILPRTVIDEFARNKERVIADSTRSMSSTLKRVKQAVDRFGDPRSKKLVLTQLDDVDHRLPTLGSAASSTVSWIENIFARTNPIEIDESLKLRAAQRAIDRRAPFHRQRNSIDDAILFEVYAERVADRSAPRTRFAFVTHNTKDFSHPASSSTLPHPDIAPSFSRIRSLYFTSLGDALRRVKPDELSDLMVEADWFDEPRRLPEILEAIDELVTKVWYNRHQIWRERVEASLIEIIETYDPSRHSETITREIWSGARKAAKDVEKRFGLKNLGPWDDFEWGMLNGKLSALRWVVGEEWDMLDT